MGTRLRVLVVEDSEDDAELLLRELRHGGYEITSERVDTAEAMRAALTQREWDIIVSDYSMPHFGGAEALNVLKEMELDLPFILVSGTIGEDVAVEAMKGGAQDYILKGHMARLLPAIKRELQKAGSLRERRRAERQIRLLSSAVEQSTEGIAIGDPRPRLIYLNEAFARMHGYSREEMFGMEFAKLHSKEQMDEFKGAIHQTKTQGSWMGEMGHIRRDGTPFPTSMSVTLVKDEAGSPMGILAVCRDITEQRQLAARFRQAQRMETVGRLAGGVAHDFNNLMTIVTGYSELALETLGEDDPLREDMEAIKRAGERATGLTRQLLAFSRKQILQPKPLDLNVLVAGMGKMLQRLIAEDIDLVTLLEASPDRVEADPGQLEQIIMNMAVNARDAMPQGGKLTIETLNAELDEDYARNRLEVEPGSYVVFAISDTGIGMDEGTRSHIFEPFFTTKVEGKGTGLGLATVYGIVKQHKGHIAVHSELGRGTTFKVYLPRLDKPVEEEEEEAEDVPAEPLQGTETILLVEDEDVVRTVATRMLRIRGYKVLDAGDGDEALQVCREQEGSIRLLITDVVMPGMSGRELAERVMDLHPQMKVLYMSGYTDNAIVHHGVLEPGTAFIEKPFTPDDLARKVREVLEAPPPATARGAPGRPT